MDQIQVNISGRGQHQSKKCHGNRKDQRFRKKLRVRGISAKKIEYLLKQKKQMEAYGMETETMAVTCVNKRKRSDIVPRSISSVSMGQSDKKKFRNNDAATSIQAEPTSIEYRIPVFLRRSQWILFQMMKQKFNFNFEDDHHQDWIYQRLELFDKQHWLETTIQFQKSILKSGQQKQCWPDHVYHITKTTEFNICQEYQHRYIEQLQMQLNECQTKLNDQLSMIPTSSEFTPQILDHGLKKLVETERQDLSKQYQRQLNEFNKRVMLDSLESFIRSQNLTDEQIDYVRQLHTIRQQQIQIWKKMLTLEIRIGQRFLPQQCDQLEDLILLNMSNSSKIIRHSIEFRNQQSKIIQRAKRQCLSMYLMGYEMQLEEYEKEFNDRCIQIDSSLSTTDNSLTSTSIRKYFNQHTHELKESITKQLPSVTAVLRRNHRRHKSSKNRVQVSPEPFLDLLSNPFNEREWNYLCLGSSFIRSNQTVVRSQHQQNIAMRNDHEHIFEQVQTYLSDPPYRIPRSNNIFKKYSTDLLEQLNESYSEPITYKDQVIANEEANMVHSIRQKLKQHELVLRVVDKGDYFYIGHSKQFERKAQEYFTKTNAFIQITDNPLDDMIQRIHGKLTTLASNKLILQWQCKQMLPDKQKTKLSHLYFNPKVHKEGIPVRPIQNTIDCPTWKISKFLDEHIRPIFDEKCKKISVINSMQIIEKLHDYEQRGLLKSRTLFCTFDIQNLYTMLPQEESLDILVEFLQCHGINSVKGINLTTIRELASIVLKENIFIYGKNIYRQTVGGAMGSSFTLTLANIFMWKWQKELVRRQDITCEIYGRYIDDIFMTWNRSEDDLRTLLNQANTWHPNIQLKYEIGRRIPFLDLLLENRDGTLFTSVYRKPNTEPYVVPFSSDHPQFVFKNVIKTQLTRVARYSSTFETFDEERRLLKLMLLYNGYPSIFINSQFREFFKQFFALSAFTQHPTNTANFHKMQRKLLGEQIDTDTNTVNEDERLTTNVKTESMSHHNQKPKMKTGEHPLLVHFTYEKRLASIPKRLHQLHHKVFKQTPVEDVRLITGAKTRRSLRHELIRKRPKLGQLAKKTKKT